MTPEEHYICAMTALQIPETEQREFVAEFRRSLVERDMRVLEDFLYGSEGAKGEVLNVEQTAEFLGFSPYTIREKARDGEIPGRKVGKEWRFSRTALLEWIREGASPTCIPSIVAGSNHSGPPPLDVPEDRLGAEASDGEVLAAEEEAECSGLREGKG